MRRFFINPAHDKGTFKIWGKWQCPTYVSYMQTWGAISSYYENTKGSGMSSSGNYHGNWHELDTDLGGWTGESGTTGSSSSHNIVQPYKVVTMYIRIA